MKYYIDVDKILYGVQTKTGNRLNQKQLAKLLGVSKQTINNWKSTGSTNVVMNLMKICEVSGLQINEFISKK